MASQTAHQESVADFSDDRLNRAFEAFARFAQILPKEGPIKISTEDQIIAYALYKQATVGVCNTPKPSMLKPTDRMKWSAWNSLKKMTKREVQITYVDNFIKRMEKNYAKHQMELSALMADQKFSEAKAFVQERKDDFGVTYMHTPQGLKEVAVVCREIGFAV